MAEIRCPECGSRLTTNECPMCMKRVPVLIPSLKKKKEIPWRERKYTSQYEMEEDHECISFDELPRYETQQPAWTKPSKPAQKKGGLAKLIPVGAILFIFTVVLPLIGGIIDIIDSVVPESGEQAIPEPMSNYTAIAPGEEGFVDPAVIFEADGVTIQVASAGWYYDDYALELVIDNQSDRDITMSTEYVVVNGFMFSGADIYCDVDAGDMTYEYMVFSQYDMERCGMEKVAGVSFALDFWDADSYDDLGSTEDVNLAPLLEEPYTPVVDDSGLELYSKDGIRLIYQGMELEEDGWCTFNFFADNQTQKNVTMSDDLVLLNGEDTDGFFWCRLQPGTRALYAMTFYDVQEDYDITYLEQIDTMTLEMTVEARDETSDSRESLKLTFDPKEITQ